MSDSDDFVSSDIENAANEAISMIIPEKSKAKYEASYNSFLNWLKEGNMKTVNEKIMLAYFLKKSMCIRPNTVWSEYSKLRATIYLNKNIDISTFTNLIAFLKRKSKGYIPKKSKIFTASEIENFLINADDKKFLLMKVVAIFGIAGACRRSELSKLSINDVSDMGVIIKVDIKDTKTMVPRQFMITEGRFKNVNLLDIFRKYTSLRTVKTKDDRFLVGYRDGKCISQAVGINSIGAVPKKIAEYLGLPDAKLYTGHCFRRTSATLLANAGGDLLAIKKHGGWKSSDVCEGYVDSSEANKCEIAKKILALTPTNPVASTSSSAMNRIISSQVVTVKQTTAVERIHSMDGKSSSLPLRNEEHPLFKGQQVSLFEGASFSNCTINFSK